MAYPKLPDGKELKSCPECLCDMNGLDPVGHAIGHYPTSIDHNDPRTELARKRQALLLSARA